MIRFLAYLGTIFVVMILLRFVPLVGGFFRIPLFGFFAAAAIVSFVGRRWAEGALARHRLKALKRQLGGVETPHNMGKLGSVLEANGSYKAALPYLRLAVEGEPNTAEWHWRLGHCLLESGKAQEAVAVLMRAIELDEKLGYGVALMQLAEALRRIGDGERALVVLDRVERNHGPSPESAYRRGRLLRQMGRKDEGTRALAQVGELAHQAAAYQRTDNRKWVWRSIWARMFG